ncbi:hypothetical protein E2C01_094565 [Portunus trituberculatus]|uniref:Secreted protein n=1 Tax=Portunus trituberculatus TaxID=210409 RepID=A0A5B7K206_PORTR|nr:hypothetical protein [Portunus trituberculatus]
MGGGGVVGGVAALRSSASVVVWPWLSLAQHLVGATAREKGAVREAVVMSQATSSSCIERRGAHVGNSQTYPATRTTASFCAPHAPLTSLARWNVH